MAVKYAIATPKKADIAPTTVAVNLYDLRSLHRLREDAAGIAINAAVINPPTRYTLKETTTATHNRYNKLYARMLTPSMIAMFSLIFISIILLYNLLIPVRTSNTVAMTNMVSFREMLSMFPIKASSA